MRRPALRKVLAATRLSLSDGAVYLGALSLLGLLLLRLAYPSWKHGTQPPKLQWWQLPAGDRYPLLDWLDGKPDDVDACPLATPGTDADDLEGAKFSVYILDADTVLEDIPGLRGKNEARCNLSSPEVWPHTQHGRGMDSSNTTEHWAYQHGVQWWFTQALLNSSLVKIVNSTEEADLIYVDLHCHTLWSISYDHPFGNKNQTNPAVYFEHIIAQIETSQRFQRKYGADYIFVQSHPAMVGGTVALSAGKMCGVLRNVYWMLPERDLVCRSDQEGLLHNRVVLVPYLTVTDLHLRPIMRADRPIFFFFRGACAPKWKDLRRAYSTGKLMRTAVVEGIRALPSHLTGLGNRTRVTCSCDICDEALNHKETMKRLSKSLFCPVVPGDTQSSRRVSEVILSGCIPVFFGPPYHTMPMADVVNYRSFSVFLHFKDTSEWILSPRRKEGEGWNDQSVLEAWQADINVSGTAHVVRSMEEAYWYLHSIPEAEIDRMQAALSRERYKLLYSPPPGADTSQLGELLVQKMCQRVRALRRLERSGELHGRRRWRQRHIARLAGGG